MDLIMEDQQPGCPQGCGLYRRGGLQYGDVILLASEDQMSGREDEEGSSVLNQIYSKARAGMEAHDMSLPACLPASQKQAMPS